MADKYKILIKNQTTGKNVNLGKLFELVYEDIRNINNRTISLEQKTKHIDNMKYMGVWRKDAIYNKGNFITHKGSLWIAETSTIDCRPGTKESGFKLVAKGTNK